MQNKGILGAAVVTVLAAVLAVLGATGPAAADAAAGRIGPGTQIVTAGRSCTANFLFRDARHRVYLGYAASCATRSRLTGPGTCAARSLPLGTRVRLVDRGHTLGYGTLRYSSLRAERRLGVTDPATCAANDFALVRLRGEARRRASASMPYWGGPTGLGALPAAGATVFGLTRVAGSTRTVPRAGQVTECTGTRATVSTPLPSTPAARGGGFLDDTGRAVGVLTASEHSGDNLVVSVADVVAFARAHGIAGLHVVRGHDAFSGAAVL
jgi:hypothetical protein